MKQLLEELQSISGIAITPFDEFGKIDYMALGKHLTFLVESGIDVIVSCGNTGEFFSLSYDECLDVIGFTCQHLRGNATVIAGVSFDLERACVMAQHAERLGSDAIMIHNPPHPFLSGPGYIHYVESIAKSVEIGVIPYIRSEYIPVSAIEAVARIPNVVGVKFALNDLQKFATLASQPTTSSAVAWICGTAEAWAPYFYSMGATGFTSGLVNVAPRLSIRFLSALRNRQLPDIHRLWNIIRPFEELRARHGAAHNVSVVKEAMQQLGLGTRKVRPPIGELTAYDRDEVKRILDTWKDFL